MEYFTVDRHGTLSPNQIIYAPNTSFSWPEEMPDYLRHTIKKDFPEGLSLWGNYFTLRPNWLYERGEDEEFPFKTRKIDYDATIDLIFELYRKANHPDKPSRLQSFYAFETLEEAEHFALIAKGQSKSTIYKIEVEKKGFKADMNNLRLDLPFSSILFLAEKYWSGEECPDDFSHDEKPEWEVLITGEILIKERVKVIEIKD